MATSKKKVVSKEELRRFMKEKQGISKLSSKKIDHPLAKYNSLNQLVCVLCNNVVKNDLLWTAHLQSKGHKEKAISLKTQGPAKPPSLQSSPLKRKAEDRLENNGVKKKAVTGSTVAASNSLPSDFFDGDNNAKRKATMERAKAALLAGYSSSSEDDDGDDGDGDGGDKDTATDSKHSQGASSNNALPADFFDSDQGPSGSQKEEPKKSKTMADVLPEGFFDDPKMDAKVRKVEYKDKMEEEWDLFQRAMKEEAHVSEVIMEEEDEQANIDRNIAEIDDQIERWREVEDLHVKKETIMKTNTDGQKKDNSDDEVDDDELDEFLDWRAKKSLKE